MVEQVRLLQLLACEREPDVDLSAALGRALAQSALELSEGRSPDEDRDALLDRLLNAERALGLEIEQRRPPPVADPVDLRPERPGAGTPRQVDVLEECVCVDQVLKPF